MSSPGACVRVCVRGRFRQVLALDAAKCHARRVCLDGERELLRFHNRASAERQVAQVYMCWKGFHQPWRDAAVRPAQGGHYSDENVATYRRSLAAIDVHMERTQTAQAAAAQDARAQLQKEVRCAARWGREKGVEALAFCSGGVDVHRTADARGARDCRLATA